MRPTLLAAAVLLAAGCNAVGTHPAERSRPVIGLSVLTLTNPFFQVIGDTMKAEADRHGYDVTGFDIVFRGLCPACRPADPAAPAAGRDSGAALEPLGG